MLNFVEKSDWWLMEQAEIIFETPAACIAIIIETTFLPTLKIYLYLHLHPLILALHNIIQGHTSTTRPFKLTHDIRSNSLPQKTPQPNPPQLRSWIFFARYKHKNASFYFFTSCLNILYAWAEKSENIFSGDAS